MKLSPVTIFAFNRPTHLQRTLTALAANELSASSSVTIFCDGPRHEDEKIKTDAVRQVALAAKGFASVTVVQREQNLGCAAAIIAGLVEMFEVHDRLIVIEDDILTSPYTLKFLNNGLTKYRSFPSVFSISAWAPPPSLMPIDPKYPYDAYVAPRFNGWGWATWRERFLLVDWDVKDYKVFVQTPILQQAFNAGGDDLTPMLKAQMSGFIDAWDIRMDYARFKHGMFEIAPAKSYTTNIGCDGSGVHYSGALDTRWDNNIKLALANPILPDHVFLHQPITKAFKKAMSKPPLWKRAVNKLARIFFKRNIF